MQREIASPACNPGFLDTLTWDETRAAALGQQAVGDRRFAGLAGAVAIGYPATAQELNRLVRGASKPPLSLVPASACAHPRHGLFLLGILTDGQHVFVSVTVGKAAPPQGFGRPLCQGESSAEGCAVTVRLFPVDLSHLRAFLAEVAPAYAPAVPSRPGLGIGCRMGVLDLPVALQAVSEL